MSVSDVYIVGAARTPIGKPFKVESFKRFNVYFTILGSFCGKLSSFKASELGTIAIREALKRASIPPQDVSEVIMGQVITLQMHIPLY